MASEPPKDQEAGMDDQAPPPYNPGHGSSDNVPPAYGDSTNPLRPPSSYDLVYGELKAARAQSAGFLDFVKKVVVIVLSTIGCTLCVGLVLAIPVSMIVIGSIYLHDCPAERYIPIYLIVAGVFGVIVNCSSIIQRLKNRNEEHDEENAKINPFDGLVGCFLFAWFICGNVWIYRTYGDWSEDPQDDDYCHPTLYWFAFWITTATYIIAGVSCVCGALSAGIAACCAASK